MFVYLVTYRHIRRHWLGGLVILSSYFFSLHSPVCHKEYTYIKIYNVFTIKTLYDRIIIEICISAIEIRIIIPGWWWESIGKKKENQCRCAIHIIIIMDMPIWMVIIISDKEIWKKIYYIPANDSKTMKNHRCLMNFYSKRKN